MKYKILRSRLNMEETVVVYFDYEKEEWTLEEQEWQDKGPYLIYKSHFKHCHPDNLSCCDECLKLNGFEIDETLPAITLEDVIESNKYREMMYLQESLEKWHNPVGYHFRN